ncbi:MAG: class I SAM-dependent methyltransferase [Candidatus Moranbacteria bacterium]|nr:class I SAM-dependent methyltransferase [Candidatus Moranbacteria bacterium]
MGIQSGSQMISKFVNPKEILDKVGLNEGDKVADFGCGPGFFTLPVAEIVGGDGEVYAFDIMPQILENVTSQAKSMGITNIATKRVNLEKEKSSGLEDNSVDLVIIKNVLFQNKNKEEIIKEAHRILKDGGKILVMEWNKRNLLVGPEESLRVDKDDLDRMLIGAGFVLKEQMTAGDFHYISIANK